MSETPIFDAETMNHPCSLDERAAAMADAYPQRRSGS